MRRWPADNTVGAYALASTVPANTVGFRGTLPVDASRTKVAAYNAHSEVMSAELRVQAGDFPGAPTALSALADSALGHAHLDRQRRQRTGFRVMRNGVQVAELTTPNATTWTDTTVNGASTYTYQVKGVQRGGRVGACRILPTSPPVRAAHRAERCRCPAPGAAELGDNAGQ